MWLSLPGTFRSPLFPAAHLLSSERWLAVLSSASFQQFENFSWACNRCSRTHCVLDPRMLSLFRHHFLKNTFQSWLQMKKTLYWTKRVLISASCVRRSSQQSWAEAFQNFPLSSNYLISTLFLAPCPSSMITSLGTSLFPWLSANQSNNIIVSTGGHRVKCSHNRP